MSNAWSQDRRLEHRILHIELSDRLLDLWSLSLKYLKLATVSRCGAEHLLPARASAEMEPAGKAVTPLSPIHSKDNTCKFHIVVCLKQGDVLAISN